MADEPKTYRIVDRHRPGEAVELTARTWDEAKRLYRERFYPGRKALPSGITYFSKEAHSNG